MCLSVCVCLSVGKLLLNYWTDQHEILQGDTLKYWEGFPTGLIGSSFDVCTKYECRIIMIVELI